MIIMEGQWEMGLPKMEDLTPLTQSLITPEIATAFGITPENIKPIIDLNRACFEAYSTSYPKEDSFDAMSLRLFSGRSDVDSGGKMKRGDSLVPDEVNSGSKDENGDDTGLNRAVKRPRLVWTPQLHKRFVDVIEHLGIDKAVPKTIMEMMNVEGLTRENVASHLQKYRLYLKRVEGLAHEAHSNPRRPPTLFDCEGFGSISTPMPVPMSMPLPQVQAQVQHQHQQQHCNSLPLMPIPVPGPPPMPYGGGFGHLGLGLGGGGSSAPPGFNCGLESGAFNMFWNRQRG